MTRLSCAVQVAFACVWMTSTLQAQMTVSGRVTSSARPVQGASVTVPELGIETRTIADGTYNFLIRATQVRGQVVSVTARHRQFGVASAQLQVTGGSVELNFALGREEPRRPADTSRVARPPVDTVRPRPGQPRGVDKPVAARSVQPTETALAVPTVAVDSFALADAAGPVDVASAIAARIPGLLVTTASVLGGSSLMVFRGPRSFTSSIQPLVVVDGIAVDNTGFATGLQQFGLGGFDYGTPLQDVPLEDIATVAMLAPADASSLYGSRAANGVLVVTTKKGAATPGLSLSHRLALSSESAARLPSFQNQYGQGSAGVFEFFDGRGGGINDAVEESWGPILQGQPVIQASLTEARRPDVRSWAPFPSSVRDYFSAGKTIDASAALQGSGKTSTFRASLGVRDANGLTPNAAMRRLGASLAGSLSPASRLTARGSLQLVGTRAEDRPGTGFDELNPVAGFTRMGRQVDLAALRRHLRDTVEQINWIYTVRNNPWYQSTANSNDDHRGHIIGAAALQYAFASWLAGSLRGGTDNFHESRNVQIAPGWKGGYPTPLGRGDFSGGGSQQQKNSSAERQIDLGLTSHTRRSVGSLSASAGVELRRNSFQSTAAVDDSTAGGARVTSSALDSGTTKVTSAYLRGSLAHSDYLLLTAGVRVEKPTRQDSAAASAVFPAVSVAYDAARTMKGLTNIGIGTAMLRASWWRAGNEITSRALSRTYAGGSPATPLLGLAASDVRGPERTMGMEFGIDLSSSGHRFGGSITGYRERSSAVLVVEPGVAAASISQLGEVSNAGLELRLHTQPAEGASAGWTLDGWLARNRNSVEKLNGATSSVALGPSLWGATLNARVGEPLGVIVGTRFLRDAGGAPLLKNGLPVPDASGPVSLGTWQPDWMSGVSSRMHYRSIDLHLLLDVRIGGHVFSATNMWGSTAGTLSSTLVGRDTGLVIAGVDSASGAPNTVNVSAESYFHALAAIHEAWVYDASFAKLRQMALTYQVPLRFVPGYREQIARVSLIGRNLFTWARAPNIDPESALSVGAFQGFEMGQLPSTRSFGVQLTVTP